MKLFILNFFLIYSATLFCQTTPFNRSKPDSIVLEIDKDRSSKKYSFNNVSAIQNKRVPVQYHYWVKNGTVIKIKRAYKLQNESVTQIHYLHNGSLIFSEESIPTFYRDGKITDTIIWAGSYYFFKSKLVDYATLGHGKSETENWDPEAEVLRNFKFAKVMVLNHIRKSKSKKVSY